MLDFDALKRGTDMLARVNEQAAKLNSGGFSKDERYWQPELDKAGNGSAIIRFLPPAPGEDSPFVRLFNYGFKGPTGKWFIENSPSTLGLPCPVLEYNSALWNSGIEANKDIARKQKRRLGFIANVYIVKHPARPSDEGKVFMYKFGAKLWGKLNDKMNPDEEDIAPMNPFDFWKGANFRLRVRKVEGFPNYDKSEFDPVSALSDDDEELKAIWKSCHKLSAEVAPDKFKPYKELKDKMEQVLGIAEGQSDKAAKKDRSEHRNNFEDTAASRFSESDEPPFDGGTKVTSTGGGDDKMGWFQNLADEV
jgi:hypothetical protein